MAEKRWGEDKQFKDCMAEMEFIFKYYIPITAAGFKKMAKKNVTSYHATSTKYVEKMIDLQNRKDVILPTFTYWRHAVRSPLDGVATKGGYVFELTGDLLFASAIDMFSRRTRDTIWIPLKQLEEFQLMDLVPQTKTYTSDFTEYLVDTQRAILDVAIEIVKPKLDDFKNKSNSEILEWLRPQVLELHIDELIDPEEMFSVIRPIVDQFKKDFNEYINHEETLWSGFIDESLFDSEFIGRHANNEFLLTNFTIKKLYISDEEFEESENPATRRELGIPIGTEAELNEKFGWVYGHETTDADIEKANQRFKDKK